MAELSPRLPSQSEPSEADYDAFCATVMASARGRWFLAEYARRHRKADTDAVLAALHRIEDMVRTVPEASPVTRLRDELRALASTIRRSRRDLATSAGGLSNAAKVMALLDLLERRIEYALAPGDDRDAVPLPVEIAPGPDPLRPHLTVVAETPVPAKPAVPAPYSSAALLPSLDGGDAGPNVVALARAPAARPAPDTASGTAMLFPSAEPSRAVQPPPQRASAAAAFADVMALSEEERIALFT